MTIRKNASHYSLIFSIFIILAKDYNKKTFVLIMKSIFTDKEITPTTNDLKKALGDTYDTWQSLVKYIKKVYPEASEEWKYTGEKYGWSFRINDKKKVLIYLLPRDQFFKAAFVLGKKACDEIFKSDISQPIIKELKAAKVYAEGRGIRIDVKNPSIVEDLKKLIDIKLAH